MYGLLKQENNGYIFLDVPDYIAENKIKQLNLENSERPSSYIKKLGAHISAIYAEELEENCIDYVDEVGDKIKFYTKFVEKIETDCCEHLIIIPVESPSLELLREKYGLSKKINDRDFHITLICKKNL